jgi:hypothetical protein
MTSLFRSGGRFTAKVTMRLSVVLAAGAVTVAASCARVAPAQPGSSGERTAHVAQTLSAPGYSWQVNGGVHANGFAPVRGISGGNAQGDAVGSNPWIDVTAPPFNVVPLPTTANCAAGSADASSGIQSAIAAMASLGGGTIFLPPGTYCLAHPAIAYYGSTTLVGAGPNATILEPIPQTGSSQLPYLVQMAQSYGGARDLGFQCQANPGTSGLGLVPYARGTQINYNRFSNLLFNGCVNGSNSAPPTGAAIVLQGAVTGAAIYWNTFNNISIYDVDVGGYASGILIGGPGTSAGIVSSNQFFGVTIGNGVNQYGIYIAGGIENQFYGLNLDNGITNDVVVSSTSPPSQYNQFYGAFFDPSAPGAVNNAEPTTAFFGTSVPPTCVTDTSGKMTLVGNYGNGTQMAGPLSVSIGSPLPPPNLGGASATASFSAGEINGSYAAVFVSDLAGRNVDFVSQNYSWANGSGSALAIGTDVPLNAGLGTGVTLNAYQSGSGGAPLVMSTTNLYLRAAGAGIILKGADGTCVELGVKAGVLTQRVMPVCP